MKRNASKLTKFYYFFWLVYAPAATFVSAYGITVAYTSIFVI